MPQSLATSLVGAEDKWHFCGTTLRCDRSLGDVSPLQKVPEILHPLRPFESGTGHSGGTGGKHPDGGSVLLIVAPEEGY